MAIKAADQITIVDVTDAYNVILSSDSYTFRGSTSAAVAGSCTTQVIAMLGSNSAAASVTASEIVCPSGVTATVNQSGDYTGSPLITISVTTSVTQPGVVKIPVHVDDVTITKEFSYGIAFTGQSGSTPAAPYNYLVGNDSVVISCTDGGLVDGAQSIVIPFSGWQGTDRRIASVTYSTLPSGMSVASSGGNCLSRSTTPLPLLMSFPGQKLLKGPTERTVLMALTERTVLRPVNLLVARLLSPFLVITPGILKHRRPSEYRLQVIKELLVRRRRYPFPDFRVVLLLQTAAMWLQLLLTMAAWIL